MKMSIQDIYDAAGAVCQLSPGEYEGPLRLTRPGVLDGGGCTLWASEGPVLSVAGTGVTVKNIRVELTGKASDIAIRTDAPDTRLENVIVRGNLAGFQAEQGAWRLPKCLTLGDFASDAENAWLVELTVGDVTQVRSLIKGVVIEPAVIPKGEASILVKTGSLVDGTFIFGDIELASPLASRRLCVTGRAKRNGTRHTETLQTQPSAQPGAGSPACYSDAGDVIPSLDLQPKPEPAGSKAQALRLQRGQRLAASSGEAWTLSLDFAGWRGNMSDLSVDAYLFLLGQDGKVRSDDDLFFFGHAEGKGISVGEADGFPQMKVDLSALPEDVQRLVAAFAIYSEPGDPMASRRNFSLLDRPAFKVRTGGDAWELPLADLSIERCLAAGEFYRHQGRWKLRIIGQGYADGLERLCETYGVQVE